ncbi:MAG TPA: SPFH domain-containing protein [Phycisphaerales bacterium]|nr:SPFH domain-containing protein [Phycisphaerales bacterium]
MNADHLSYKRATTVSLVGLAVQAVLAVLMLIYGRLGGDPAATTGAIAMLLGLPVWASLALVFHQHRLERLEALETEAYRASTAAQASVFEQAGADQTVQAGKLAWMHRWFLPAVSLLFAAAMVGVGIVRFLDARETLRKLGESSIDFQPPPLHGWAIAIGVGVAVIGFIFARFIAGMAKERVWSLLHAGSAVAVAAALIGAAQVVSHFLFIATRKSELLQYLPAALAVFMIAIGAEALLNFVLNLYRPRRAGEYQRPAFDSRVLSFIAAPDRLAASLSEAVNYQFGFDVSSTWFYRLIARSVGSLFILGVLAIWAMSLFAVVKPDETGLLLVNGKLVRTVDPGLVIKYPWPFSTVVTFPSSAAARLNIGAQAPNKDGPILWTTEHSEDEKDRLFLLQPAAVDRRADARSGDLVLMAAEVPVLYRVADLQKYLALAQDGPGDAPDKTRQDFLTSVASGLVIRHVATRRLDEMLGPDRSAIADEIKSLLQSEFDKLNAGVQVIFVGISGVHPEQSVAPAFEAVVQKDQRREALIEQSQAFAIRELARVAGEAGRARNIIAELDRYESLKNENASEPQRLEQEQKILDLITNAGGEAASLIADARAYRWERHMSLRSQAVRADGRVASYRAAPLYYKAAEFVEAMRTALKQTRVIISPFPNPRIDLNKEESEPNISSLASPSDKPAQ